MVQDCEHESHSYCNSFKKKKKKKKRKKERIYIIHRDKEFLSIECNQDPKNECAIGEKGNEHRNVW